ncbi:hypothetical protein [Qipengyuania sp. DGS5-3]|uniref:hypothetical protein n=1 Tax=Qipengyuania sp. DGS5-3 TaxID=3349632 RepID=UPI0036D35CF8
MTKFALGLVAFSTLLASPALGANAEELSVPTPVDFRDVRTKTDAIIERLKTGAIEETITDVAKENPLLLERRSDLQSLINQFESVTQTYGAIEDCSPWEQSYKSRLRITTTYICQHRDSLIMWEFQTDRLSRGWIVSNLRFDGTF